MIEDVSKCKHNEVVLSVFSQLVACLGEGFRVCDAVGGPEERADPFVWKCSESSRSPSSLWYEMRCLLNKDRWLWMLT